MIIDNAEFTFEPLGRTRVRLDAHAVDTFDRYHIEDALRTKHDISIIDVFKVNEEPRIKLDIKKVIFNNPATIVLWADGTKTVVKKQKGDRYDKEKGLAMCIAKKALGNKGNYCNVFKEWL